MNNTMLGRKNKRLMFSYKNKRLMFSYKKEYDEDSWALSCSIRDNTAFHDFSLNARGLAVSQLITHVQPISRTYACIANSAIVR